MASITSWTRLEPRARGADLRPSIEGRVHDPLWLLGRQWQVGEFQGEDAGTPVAARLRGRADVVTAWRPGPGPDAPLLGLDAAGPLEAMVEREDPAPDGRLSAETGQHLLRLLTAAGLGRYRPVVCRTYPLMVPPDLPFGADPDGARYFSVMAGRVPDGDELAAAVRGPLERGALPAELVVDPADRDDVRGTLEDWLAWYDALVLRPPEGTGAWDPRRLEHTFAAAVSVNGVPAMLEASEYPGGSLDWHSFSVGGGGLPPGAVPERSEDLVVTALATPAGYPGMPSRRWWQFEDARVDFGGIEAAPEDLARMLLAEFATVYGNDWYLLPVQVPVGSLVTVDSLVVMDTFGERTLVPRVRDPQWSLFEVSLADARPGNEQRGDRLFVPPSPVTTLEGEPVENVLLTRDERANLAWAIEHVVEGVAGGRVDRFSQWQVRRAALPDAPIDREPTAEDRLEYRLMSDVPDHWIPLVPHELASGRVELRRGAVRRAGPTGEVEIPPLGRLLTPGSPLAFPEEEVPREGATVTRSWQYTRWSDGETLLWLGRRKRPGRGESSSGLVFDRLVAAEVGKPTQPE